MLENLQNLFEMISPRVAYFVFFLAAFLENIIPPVPGDTVVVIGAYLVYTKELNFLGVYISTCLGGIIGFMTMFMLGARFGRSFFYKKSRSKIYNLKYLDKVEIWFSKWGYWVIFANRFLSGTRSVISIFAGLFHLNVWIVLLLATFSMLIWNGLLIFAGILLGENWNIIMHYITNYNKIIIAFTIIILIYIVYRLRKRKKGLLKNDQS